MDEEEKRMKFKLMNEREIAAKEHQFRLID
jgi:hypothetical protein